MISFITKSLTMNMNDRVDAVFVQFQHLRWNVRIFWRGSQMVNSYIIGKIGMETFSRENILSF